MKGRLKRVKCAALAGPEQKKEEEGEREIRESRTILIIEISLVSAPQSVHLVSVSLLSSVCFILCLLAWPEISAGFAPRVDSRKRDFVCISRKGSSSSKAK